MSYLLARIVNRLADKVFGAVDAALFCGFDLDTREECRAPSSLWCLGCQADMCGWPDQDGAAQLAAREAENEVHEPGGCCPNCGATKRLWWEQSSVYCRTCDVTSTFCPHCGADSGTCDATCEQAHTPYTLDSFFALRSKLWGER